MTIETIEQIDGKMVVLLCKQKVLLDKRDNEIKMLKEQLEAAHERIRGMKEKVARVDQMEKESKKALAKNKPLAVLPKSKEGESTATLVLALILGGASYIRSDMVPATGKKDIGVAISSIRKKGFILKSIRGSGWRVEYIPPQIRLFEKTIVSIDSIISSQLGKPVGWVLSKDRPFVLNGSHQGKGVNQ